MHLCLRFGDDDTFEIESREVVALLLDGGSLCPPPPPVLRNKRNKGGIYVCMDVAG